jgi:hypothetical protein
VGSGKKEIAKRRAVWTGRWVDGWLCAWAAGGRMWPQTVLWSSADAEYQSTSGCVYAPTDAGEHQPSGSVVDPLTGL